MACKQKEDLKINIGCGPTGKIQGFQNLDNSPSVLLSKAPFLKKILFTAGIITKQQFEANWSGVIWCDTSKGLPYKTQSVAKIYMSHFLEHVPYNKGVFVLEECYRVLIKGGIMRLVLPDLYWHAQKYITNTNAIFKQSVLPQDRHAHDEFLDTVYGAYLKERRYGAEHCYMYDLPTVVAVLKSVGFEDIIPCGFQQGSDAELASYDNRPEDSLCLEIKR